MTRFFVGIGAVLVAMIALTIGAASVLGRVRGGELLAYATESTPYIGTSDVYLLDTTYRISVRWISEWDPVSSITSSPNGQVAILGCTITCNLLIWDSQNFHEIPLTPQDVYPAWSNDGRLAFQSCDESECHISFWENGSVSSPPELAGLSVRNFSWSHDGRLAFDSCLGKCDIMVWDGTILLNLTSAEPVFSSFPVWSNNGQLAFRSCVTREECSLMLWDGALVHMLASITDFEDRSVAWSPDGQITFNVCDPDCHVMIWDDGAISRLSGDFILFVSIPEWNRFGQVTFQGCNGVTCDLMILDAGTIHQFIGEPYIKPFSWSPDGQLIFHSCDGDFMCDLWLWDGVAAIQVTNTPTVSEYLHAWLP